MNYNDPDYDDATNDAFDYIGIIGLAVAAAFLLFCIAVFSVWMGWL